MKFVIAGCISLALAGCVTAVAITEYHHVHAADHHKKPIIPILKQDFHLHHEGYRYGYESGNGIHVQETGYIKNKGDKKHETIVQQGIVTYHDEHGRPITLTYIADEHGFQPQGAHLPTPPPVPAEIAKTLENNVQHELDVGPQQYEHY